MYGDGSIVIVPAPGHTPGSVIVFLAPPDGPRYALIGDVAWQLEGVTEREERPWLTRTMADADPGKLRRLLPHLSALARRFPELVIVPAHDPRAYRGMPRLDGGLH